MVAILEIFSYLGAIALVVVVVWSFVVMLTGPGILTGLNDRCSKYSAACGVAIGIQHRPLPAALASAIFLLSRRRLVKKENYATAAGRDRHAGHRCDRGPR